MDFFNSTETTQNPTDSAPGIDSFAKAIQDRFGPQSSLFTPLPMLATPSPRPAPAVKSPVSPPSSFETITPSTLSPFLSRSKTLVLDIRPHHAFSTARVTSAISFSVPSTLLKRPLFSTQRLGAMLSSRSARTKFATWADHNNILVYDADSTSIPPTSNINGLLQKFRNEGYTGNLAYISGGFQAVWKERRELTTSGPPSVEEDEEDDNAQSTTSSVSKVDERPTLRTKHLPMSAFSIASTTASHTSSSNNPSNYHPGVANVDSRKNVQSASNPFFDSIRQNVELSQGVTERIPLRLSSRVRRRIPDIPFPWLQSIARHAARNPDSPPMVSDSSASETEGETDNEIPVATQAEQDEATEALALQFYRIELAEQRRLQAVMDFHSNESRDGKPSGSADFPYSITAGIEKGAKNRYRHIWPFEHARVRLQPSTTSPSSEKDDYVNASYVQPLGTNKRYIATQGPLDATFTDFWILVWQQNVHVIVMLTREVEGSLVKCGRYWEDGQYGPLTLTMVSEVGDLEHQAEKNVSGGGSAFFSEFKAEKQRERQELPAYNKTIKRVFRLRHSKYPDAGERRVIQLQYLGWPDMTVPDDPRGIVQLVRETNAAVQETDDDLAHLVTESNKQNSYTSDWHRTRPNRPILLHCSAGVGRTGGFIAVDAILDGLRREIRQSNVSKSTGTSNTTRQEDDSMDVDPRSTVESPAPISKDADMPAPTPLEAKTRQWAQLVSESTKDEKPLNPNRHTPIPPSAAVGGSSRPLDANRSYRSSEDRSSTELSRFTSGSSSLTSFSPLSQIFPSVNSDKQEPAPGSGLQNEMCSTKPLSQVGGTTYDRSRAFSTPTNGVSGFLSPLKHRASVSSVYPAPLQASPPTSLSSSPTPAFQSASGSSNSSLGSIGRPNSGMQNVLASMAAAQVGAENSSSNPSVISSRSPSPSVRPAAGLTGQNSSSSSNPSLPFRMTMPVPQMPLHPPAPSGKPRNVAKMVAPALSPNYTQPRKIHENAMEEPSSLSSLEDPILEVLQDMREQRMSLCQSLRQYVFVHAAVIEGAIQIVDEERKEREAEKDQVASMDATPLTRPELERGSSSSIATLSTGKRGASPTELPIEDKLGGVRLAKRPSVKKKNGSDESYHVLLDTPSVQTPKAIHLPSLTTLSSSRESSSDI